MVNVKDNTDDKTMTMVDPNVNENNNAMVMSDSAPKSSMNISDNST
jgi:hypothetical protein